MNVVGELETKNNSRGIHRAVSLRQHGFLVFFLGGGILFVTLSFNIKM